MVSKAQRQAQLVHERKVVLDKLLNKAVWQLWQVDPLTAIEFATITEGSFMDAVRYMRLLHAIAPYM